MAAPPRLGANAAKTRALSQLARVTRRVHPRGTDRALRMLYSPDRRATDHFESVLTYDANLRIRCDTASFIEWQIFFYGHYEPEIARVIRRLLPAGGTAVDAGANVGCHTLVMADAAGTNGRVLAFEPHPRTFRRLGANVHLNALTNIDAWPVGLSDRHAELQLHSPAIDHPLPGKATMHAENLADRTHIPVTEQFPVRVLPLDAVAEERGIERLDLIKIDVEGHEMAVLRGTRESIARFRPHVIVGYTTTFWHTIGETLAGAQSFFNDLNYDLRVIEGANLSAVPHDLAHGNLLASPRK